MKQENTEGTEAVKYKSVRMTDYAKAARVFGFVALQKVFVPGPHNLMRSERYITVAGKRLGPFALMVAGVELPNGMVMVPSHATSVFTHNWPLLNLL